MKDAERAVVSQLWSYCAVLRDDGLSYPDYVEQLTYLLFLKMADEVDASSRDKDNQSGDIARLIPVQYNWQSLIHRQGRDLAQHYESTLSVLGELDGMLGVIFADARNKIRDPRKLELLVVDLINRRNWSALGIDVKGSAYEGLLEKNAQDTKSGAGQYFTPRPLVDGIVECIRPSYGEVVYDPACGTGGFLIAAHRFIQTSNPNMSRAEQEFVNLHSVRGAELVGEVTRLASMNLFLHGIGPIGNECDVPVVTQDSLANLSDQKYDVLLSNPPFGKRSSGKVWVNNSERRGTDVGLYRPDLWVSTSNKELNFLQHVATLIKPGGRAAVIVPDGVLTGAGAGSAIRRRLLAEFDLHTILRLPTGLFYAQGVNANVLFFDRPDPSGSSTRAVWVYDLRSNKRFSLMSNRFGPSDIQEFVGLYCADNRSERHATWSEADSSGRWRAFPVASLLQDDDVSLDINWINPSSGTHSEESAETLISSIVSDLEMALEEARRLLD